MVTSEVAKALANSSTLTSPCSSSSARMAWRRWGVLRFVINESFDSKDNGANQNLTKALRQPRNRQKAASAAY
ncbi:hypothetical protein D3C77_778310 [compost metagenome]